MHKPRIVSSAEWQSARETLLVKEKALLRAQDALAAERRRMPWERVEKHYTFDTPAGRVDLAGLFDGRQQLLVYHHMLKADDPSPCAGCCMVGDQIPHLAHLHARNTTLVFVSDAPLEQIEAFRKRMGWSMPWFKTTRQFNVDFGVASGFGLNVFYRNGKNIFRTYFTTNRGVEPIGTVWAMLDTTPLGRQENWEVSPDWIRQSAPYQWWRLHDEYAGKESVLARNTELQQFWS